MQLIDSLNARKSVRGGLPDDTDNNNGTSSMSMNRMRPRAVEFEPQTLNNKVISSPNTKSGSSN